MKKTVFIFVIAALTSYYAIGQTAEQKIKWDKTVHDFGVFNEEDGNQTAVFEFTNDGDSPLFITNVRASCGCTTPEWSKEPIQPGDKGFIKAAYNPANRPGKFNKSITVTTNEENPTSVLRISGDVIPKNTN